MDYAGLCAALTVRDGALLIGRDTLTPNIAAFLDEHLDGTPITITSATAESNDTAKTVTIRGNAPFFAAPDVPVELTAAVGVDGNALLALTYNIPDTWRFSDSFRDLPVVPDWADPEEPVSRSPLDALHLSGSKFFVHTGSVPGVTADTGITFRGEAAFVGVRVVETLLTAAPRMSLTGSVARSGIHLKADVGATPSVGDLRLEGLAFRLYSPLTQTWAEENPEQRLVFGYSAELVLSSANQTKLSVFAELQLGADELLLTGLFSGVTLSALTGLADLTGRTDLQAGLPPKLSALQTLGKLELLRAGISLTLSDKGVGIGWATVTVGMPQLNWDVWTNHFRVESVAATFSVAGPFGDKPKFSATVTGTVAIEKVPVNVFARKDDDFLLYAELGEAQTIPLRSLLKGHLTELDVPDLTIDSMRLSVTPGKEYGFAMAMAGEPNPWRLPLGAVELVVSNVSCALSHVEGSGVSGAFAGTVKLGQARLSVGYTVPGDVSFAGGLEQIRLTELARELACADLWLPAGFPDLTLKDVRLVFAKNGDNYDASVATTVAIGDAVDLGFAAVVTRSSETTGFAVGIWTERWADGNGWSPGALWEPLRALTFESIGLFLCSAKPTTDQLNTLVPAKDVDRAGFDFEAGVTLSASLRLDTGSVALLGAVFGPETRLNLFAACDRDGRTKLLARLASISRTAFLFSKLELRWDSKDTSVAVTAGGVLTVSESPLEYSVTGQADSSSVQLALRINDWVHPFGYEKLTVTDFVGAIAVDDIGFKFTLGGAFRFVTGDNVGIDFALAVTITDFEAPTALVFELHVDSYRGPLRISEVIKGITTLDVAFLPGIWLLDQVLRITDLAFWAVDKDIVIDKVRYGRGFGFRGMITLFGKPLRLEVDVREKERKFSGHAELPEAVTIGKVLTLSRSETDLTAGPVFAVSSHIENEHKDYLYASAAISLLDMAHTDVYCKANDDGLTLLMNLKAGQSGEGAWTDQHLEIFASREKSLFRLAFNCDFGMKNVSLGGFTVFGQVSVPRIDIPDFAVKADLRIEMDASAGTFHLGGALHFTFMGESLDTGFSINVKLLDAPGKLAEIGALLLDWISNNLASVLEGALGTAAKFGKWIRDNAVPYALSALGIALALGGPFGLGAAAALRILAGSGLSGDAVSGAMRDAFSWTDPILRAADQAFAEFTSRVGTLIGASDVDLVVFNLTPHTLEVTGAHGDEITPHTGSLIKPGDGGIVARYRASSGTWEWVYLRDNDTGQRYQLYIQLSSIISNRYTGFDHYNPHPQEENSGSVRLPADVASSRWDGGQAAAYTLHRIPGQETVSREPR